VWVYFWVLYKIALIYVIICVPVACRFCFYSFVV
jgi:hypothetical protein